MLPNLFKSTLSPSSCGGSAITVGQKMLSKNGGRISLFSTTRISEGLGKLQERTPNDGECLNGVTDFYKTLAIEANQQHIAIDLFLFGHQFQDIASLAPVARNSAGHVYRYPGKKQLLWLKFHFVFRFAYWNESCSIWAIPQRFPPLSREKNRLRICHARSSDQRHFDSHLLWKLLC